MPLPGASVHAFYRSYPNGSRARITPSGNSFILELYDERGQRNPDLPVIASTLEEAQQLADDHAGVPGDDPWIPVYPGTFTVVLPDEFVR